MLKYNDTLYKIKLCIYFMLFIFICYMVCYNTYVFVDNKLFRGVFSFCYNFQHCPILNLLNNLHSIAFQQLIMYNTLLLFSSLSFSVCYFFYMFYIYVCTYINMNIIFNVICVRLVNVNVSYHNVIYVYIFTS